VIEDHLEHEAIELGFGQRVGALQLDRVLGGEDEEGLLQDVRLALLVEVVGPRPLQIKLRLINVDAIIITDPHRGCAGT
jgi:hypothetical protein